MKPLLASSFVAASLAAVSLAGCIIHTGGTRSNPPPGGGGGGVVVGGGGGSGTPVVDPALTADGHHFATARHYQGACAPAGSRGGCYALDFQPDGSYRQWLLDAAMTGSYDIAGDKLTLTPSNPAAPATMTLSADKTKLDDYVYQPPTAQVPVVQ